MKRLFSMTPFHRSQGSLRLGAGLVLTGLLLQAVGLPALAGYVPPSGSTAPRSGSSTPNTVRGGCQDQALSGLTVLAPQTHVGQTSSLQPTFVWFAAERTAFPMEFRIFEYPPNGNPQEIFETELEVAADADRPGMMSFSLDDTPLELAPGKTYRWQVVILCNPNRPSTALVSEADITVVPLPEDLTLALAAAQTPSERADLYARAGIWYDAIAEVAPEPQTSGLPELARSLLTDLADLEAQADRSGEEMTYSDQLRQIIDLIR